MERLLAMVEGVKGEGRVVREAKDFCLATVFEVDVEDNIYVDVAEGWWMDEDGAKIAARRLVNFIAGCIF